MEKRSPNVAFLAIWVTWSDGINTLSARSYWSLALCLSTIWCILVCHLTSQGFPVWETCICPSCLSSTSRSHTVSWPHQLPKSSTAEQHTLIPFHALAHQPPGSVLPAQVFSMPVATDHVAHFTPWLVHTMTHPDGRSWLPNVTQMLIQFLSQMA